MLDRWFTDAEIKEWERKFSCVLHSSAGGRIADLMHKIEHTAGNMELKQQRDELIAAYAEAAWLANLRDADALGKLTATALPALRKVGDTQAKHFAVEFERELNIRMLVARLEDLAMAVETLEHAEGQKHVNRDMLTASNCMRVVVNALRNTATKESVKAMRVVNFEHFILPVIDSSDVSKAARKAVHEEAHALYSLICNIEHAL